MRFPLVIFIFALPFLSWTAHADIFRGRLVEKGTKTPIEGASVFLLPAKLKATTEQDGTFQFDSIPENTSEIVVNQTGFIKLSEEFRFLSAGERKGIDETTPEVFYLERETYVDRETAYETTITDKEIRRDDSKRTLTSKQAVSLPGSGNDAIRAIQNLPGVARVPGLSSRIVIQGSAPQDTRYTIDGHEVPIIFHFGGFSSVIQPEALDRIDYLSAGYGPDFGRAQGGLIGGWTKTPDRQRLRGFAFFDLLNAGGAIETPIDEKSSLFVGVRKSYIGALLKAVAKEEEDFNLTAAPSFDDASLIYHRKLSDKDDFKFVTIGSRDTLEFILSKPIDGDPELRGDFYNRTAFVRLIPQWMRRHDNGSITRASLGFGKDYVKFIFGDDYFDLRNQSVSIRAEHERDLAPTHRWILGMDHRLNWTDLTLRLPAFFEQGEIANPLSSGETRELTINNSANHNWGAYTQTVYTGIDRVSLKPGLRLDYFQRTKEYFLAPRFAARRQMTESFALRTATGMYYQPASPQESSAEVGNPDIQAPRAFHLMLGAEKDFRNKNSDGFTLTTGPFYRDFRKLVVRSTSLVNRGGALVPEFYNNSGTGQSYGMEVFLQGNFFPMTLTTSYTLSRSVRREPGIGRYPSQYDQTHNLNIIGAKELLRNWRVSSRFRYVTGNPLTPVTGSVFDADNGSYIPTRGAFFSTRTSPFWQLDLRVDKRWIYKTWILSAYFDFQNVTNRRNVENVQYSYDYRQREDAVGLPLLPILGLKGEF